MIIVPAIIKIIESCKRSLVTDDPYQFERLPADQLVVAVMQGFHSKALFDEVRLRLRGDLTPEDREILTKLLPYERKER